mgnify:FL=1
MEVAVYLLSGAQPELVERWIFLGILEALLYNGFARWSGGIHLELV